MSRIVQRILGTVLLALFTTQAIAWATDLTGTFHKPDGTPVSGKLIFLLSQPARLSDNSAQVVPMVKIFTVSSGQLESGAFIYGNDALVPAGTHYLVRLVDDSNNLLFEQKWSIQGTTLDLGTMTPTTTGVVLPDPLVKNVTTDQAVQGPVTFSGGITTVSLLLSGNLGPSADGVFDLGSGALRWREIHAEQSAGRMHPGTTSGTVTPTASAPGLAQESTTGGTIADGTYYCVSTLVNLNGESTPSPEQTIVISAGTGTAQIFAALTGREWLTGAPWFRLYCGTVSGGPYFLQTPKSHVDTMDADTVSRDAAGFVTLTKSSHATMGITDGDEIIVAGATGCTDNPNGTFRVYEHTAIASPAASTVIFKSAGAVESGCGGASITVSRYTGVTAAPSQTLPAHLVGAHLVRGDIILTAIAGSGANPPSTNTAAIDDVQVALNSTRTNLQAGGTSYRTDKALQLAEGNDQISAGKPFYGLSTPLVMSTGDRVHGVSASTLSQTNFGTLLWCRSSGAGAGVNANWNKVYDQIGCVMAFNGSGYEMSDVNVLSEANAVHLYHSNSDAESSSRIRLSGGTWQTSGAGTHCPAPLRINGRYYYLHVDNIELQPATTTDCFATSGHPRGAALIVSNPAGSEWVFRGPSRWTVPAKHDFIQNRGGPTDPDRAAQRAGFPTRASLNFESMGHMQGTAGGGTGILCRCQDTVLKLRGFPGMADYNVGAGTDALVVLGSNNGDGGTGNHEFAFANIGGISNNAASIRLTRSGAGNFTFSGGALGGPATIIDFGNLPSGFNFFGTTDTAGNGLCNPANSYFANRPVNAPVSCTGNFNQDTATKRRWGHTLWGAVLFQGNNSTPADSREWFHWVDNSTGFDMYRGADGPATAANRRLRYAANETIFYGADGTTPIATIDKANNSVILIQVDLAATTFANLGTPANGRMVYCSDCVIANPCTGSGTGAIAKRLNGVWVCN